MSNLVISAITGIVVAIASIFYMPAQPADQQEVQKVESNAKNNR